MRLLSLLVLSLLPASCQLDQPDDVAAYAAKWLEIERVTRHESRLRCTATVLRLTEDGVLDTVYPVGSAEQAVLMMSYGQAIALQVEGRTPHELSSAPLLGDGNIARWPGDCLVPR